MMTYKGYTAKVEFDAEAGILHGEIADIADVITFQAESVPEIKREFEAAVDDYLEFCQEQGIAAKKPFSGRFLLRVSPELHRTAAIEAKLSGQSLNSWVALAIQERATRGPEHRNAAELYRVVAQRSQAPAAVRYTAPADVASRKPSEPKAVQDWNFLASLASRREVPHGA